MRSSSRSGPFALLLAVLGCLVPVRASAQIAGPLILPSPAGLGGSCGLFAPCPFTEGLAAHLRFSLSLSAATATHEMRVGGQLALSLSAAHLFEGGMALAGDYAQRVMVTPAGDKVRGPVDHWQGPLTIWARASTPPLGDYQDRGPVLAVQAEDAVGRAPFDRAGTLAPQTITATAMAGYLHPWVRAHAGAGVLVSGTPLQAQAAQLSAGLSVRTFSRHLHVFAEGVARVAVPGADPIAAGVGVSVLVGVRLFDEFGTGGAVAYGRRWTTPDAPAWSVTVQGAYSFGTGYKVPPPDPAHPPLMPMLEQWLTDRLRQHATGRPAAQLAVAPIPEGGWPAEGAYCRLPPRSAPLRLLRSCVAGYHFERPDPAPRTYEASAPAVSPRIDPWRSPVSPLTLGRRRPHLHLPGLVQAPPEADGAEVPEEEGEATHGPGARPRSAWIWNAPWSGPVEPTPREDSMGRPGEPAPVVPALRPRPLSPAEAEAQAQRLQEWIHARPYFGPRLPSPEAGQARSPAPQTPPEAVHESPPTGLPRGSRNPTVAAASRNGTAAHLDKPDRLPDQTRAQYPETEFRFARQGERGQDVRVVGGRHPSDYPGSTWPKGVDRADFKPNTPGGRRTFARDRKTKWAEPTHMLPYDPQTGKLVK